MLRHTSAVVAASAPEQVLPAAPAAGMPARAGLVARVKQRLFPPSAAPRVGGAPHTTASEHLPAVVKKNKVSFQASIAELLLVNRLKARLQRDHSASMMERASQIIFVTCKSWFSSTDQQPTRHETRL